MAKMTHAAVEWRDGTVDKNVFTVDHDGVKEFAEVVFQYFRGLTGNVIADNMDNDFGGGVWMGCWGSYPGCQLL